jgi:hypothetical protein
LPLTEIEKKKAISFINMPDVLNMQNHYPDKGDDRSWLGEDKAYSEYIKDINRAILFNRQAIEKYKINSYILCLPYVHYLRFKKIKLAIAVKYGKKVIRNDETLMSIIKRKTLVNRVESLDELTGVGLGPSDIALFLPEDIKIANSENVFQLFDI